MVSGRKSAGFTYIGVLLATAILTAGLGLVIEAWHTTLRREKEADLQHVGIQYQRAKRREFVFSRVKSHPMCACTRPRATATSCAPAT